MATYQIPPPAPMECNGDVATNWMIFQDAYDDYATAAQLSDKGEEVQAATLKTIMGKECKQILNHLGLTTEELKKSSTILDKLQQHFAPARNILYERYRFHSAEQQPNESVDQFVIRLKQLVESCAFSALHDEMIHDRLVLGTHDRSARVRLFHEKDCDLRKTIEAIRVSEATRHQLKDIGDRDEPHTVSAVRQQGDKTVDQAGYKRRKQTIGSHQKCTRCGNIHSPEPTKCPALGKQCHACGKLNHFQSVCRTKYRQPSSTPTPKISQMVDTSDSEDCIFAIESVGAVCHNHQNQYFVSLKFIHSGRNTVIKCQLDTGATCNVMSYTDLCAVQQSNNPMNAINNHKIEVL